MIKYYDIEQCSDEWFELRAEKLTGSHATCIGANGKGLKTYAKDIVSELYGGKSDFFTNSDIERGNELESLGLTAYELQAGVRIKTTGFVTNSKYENVGVSPDGLVGDDGGVEMKARNNKKHFSLIAGETTEIPKNQIQMCLLITERKWWDFISFNPNFSKPLFIKRILPDLDYFEKLKQGFIVGNKLISEYKEKYKGYKI